MQCRPRMKYCESSRHWLAQALLLWLRYHHADCCAGIRFTKTFNDTTHGRHDTSGMQHYKDSLRRPSPDVLQVHTLPDKLHRTGG